MAKEKAAIDKKKAAPKNKEEKNPEQFLVVGIAASSGGIEAIQAFFRHTPPKTGIIYLVMLQFTPDQDNKLITLLASEIQLPVIQVTEKEVIKPDHVYILSPGKQMVIEDNTITVALPVLTEERMAPVDVFYRTIAERFGNNAVAVILSGTGAAGSMGIKRIKERGGVCFVQNPREASFNEMPRSAISTELVDDILPVAAIPVRILAYKTNRGIVQITDAKELQPEDEQQCLRQIFTLIRQRTGHDFSNYKRPTLLRRIERRINVRNLPDLASYTTFLAQDPDEPNALLKDLLISVTNFFRDKNAYNLMEEDIIPRLLQHKTAEDHFRIWVAGCATGEEAYSLGMLIIEKTLGLLDVPKIQIFATDIDESAIAQAREGYYSANDTADVSPERLRRFFNKEGEGYRIRREVREVIMFAHHNFLKDPPFSHLDIISCRNVLIYLNQTAQERAIETFHFALNPGAYLFLGSAESVEGANDLYAIYNRDNHIFESRRVNNPRVYRVPESVPSLYFNQSKLAAVTENEKRILERISYGDLHQQLLEEYAPPSMVLNKDYDIVHLTEKAGRYLQVGGGELSRNIMKLIKAELRLELRSALYQATQRQTAVEARGLQVINDDKTETLNIHVRPVLRSDDDAKGYILILFEPTEQEYKQDVIVSSDEPVAKRLEEELIRLKAQARTVSEQHDFQAEELKAANEELQAMNEELRSAAEELETSKEELQSMNEELRTVNQELKIKIEETSIASDNLKNLTNSTDIGTIFLDRGFRIVLFTPAVRNIFNLIPADHGRSLSDINCTLKYDKLMEDAATVLQTLTVIQKEVTTRDKKNYLMRVTPYRTDEDRIKGVVITFVDITQHKKIEEALAQSEEKYRTHLEDQVLQRTRELQRSNQDLMQFAHIISHDLKEPVRKIKTFVGLLESTLLPPLPEKAGYYLTKTRVAAERISNMIHAMLDYSRIDVNRDPPESVDLNLVFDQVEADLELPIAEKQASVIRPELPAVKANEVLLHQLFCNLLSNSLKFAKENTSPVIQISYEVINIHSSALIRLNFQDNGIGFDEAYNEMIFDPFTRLHPKDKYEGTGLGLALCKKIVERYGGSIEAKGVQGEGALFIILLPA